MIGGPVFAIIFGMFAALRIKDQQSLKSGVAFTSKKILQAAVVLLGFGMNLSVITQTGLRSFPIILSTIGISLLTAFIMGRAMKISPITTTLIGVGSSICGGSAIAATAPVIGASDEEIAQSISVVFLYNVIAALVFPALGSLLGLSDYGFGLFAGTAVNDTSSVTAAAAAWDAVHRSDSLSIATVVKLTRTLAIIPITLTLGFQRAARNKDSISKNSIRISKIFPMFILFFLVASVITTFSTSMGLPASVFAPVKILSKFLIVMSMAAIGLQTDIKLLITKGGKPLLAGLICWVSVSGVSLLMQRLLGIW